jgi:7,8-dihydropterin-6-yl-methyl-4-(beta-D-ribofuranosyl)aminobenzene 5'-phosphate synthase
MRLLILCDNTALPGFSQDWGFSALLETEEESILFDTGSNPQVLKANAHVAGVDLSLVTKVFISHNHWDHTGGLPYVLTLSQPEVFVPEADCEDVERAFNQDAVYVPVGEPTFVGPNLVSAGAMPTGLPSPAQEHSLLVKAPAGDVLLTGCSHPGILNICEKATQLTGRRLLLVVGGFHLYKAPKDVVFKVAESLKDFSDYMAPCHCTGGESLKVFKDVWADAYIDVSAGVEIPLEGGF